MSLRKAWGRREKSLTLELSSTRNLVENMCIIVSKFQSAKIGVEPLHATFPLPCRLVRVLGAVIQVAVLSVLHPRQDLPLRRAVVAYLSPADNVSRLLPYRLHRMHQPVMSLPNWFSTPRSTLWTSIGAHASHSPARSLTGILF